MSVITVDRDLGARTLTLLAGFDVPVGQVWELWADPRRLERWWGPPTYPATVEEHDLAVGGLVAYTMRGPDGDATRGWWRVIAVDAPASLDFGDGFARPDGSPNPDLPETAVHVRLTEHDGGTEMVVRSTFASREQMEQLMAMGMVEGITASAEQMDAALAG